MITGNMISRRAFMSLLKNASTCNHELHRGVVVVRSSPGTGSPAWSSAWAWMTAVPFAPVSPRRFFSSSARRARGPDSRLGGFAVHGFFLASGYGVETRRMAGTVDGRRRLNPPYHSDQHAACQTAQVPCRGGFCASPSGVSSRVSMPPAPIIAESRHWRRFAGHFPVFRHKVEFAAQQIVGTTNRGIPWLGETTIMSHTRVARAISLLPSLVSCGPRGGVAPLAGSRPRPPPGGMVFAAATIAGPHLSAPPCSRRSIQTALMPVKDAQNLSGCSRPRRHPYFNALFTGRRPAILSPSVSARRSRATSR